VWNSNGYTTKTTSSLLQGVIDVYLPDLKYGNNECAHKLSGVNKYLEFVQSGIEATIKSGVKTIVRILVIPGHIECCHLPAIEWLAQFKCYKNLWISVLDQYVPEFKAADIKELNRCPVPAEVEYVEYMAEKNGLKDIDKNPEGFWI
jgi:putative pyruvate formate lyase activating enzyme